MLWDYVGIVLWLVGVSLFVIGVVDLENQLRRLKEVTEELGRDRHALAKEKQRLQQHMMASGTSLPPMTSGVSQSIRSSVSPLSTAQASGHSGLGTNPSHLYRHDPGRARLDDERRKAGADAPGTSRQHGALVGEPVREGPSPASVSQSQVDAENQVGAAARRDTRDANAWSSGAGMGAASDALRPTRLQKETFLVGDALKRAAREAPSGFRAYEVESIRYDTENCTLSFGDTFGEVGRGFQLRFLPIAQPLMVVLWDPRPEEVIVAFAPLLGQKIVDLYEFGELVVVEPAQAGRAWTAVEVLSAGYYRVRPEHWEPVLASLGGSGISGEFRNLHVLAAPTGRVQCRVRAEERR